MRFRDLITTVNQAGIWTVHLYGHVAARRPHRQFGDRDSQRHVYNEIVSGETPMERYDQGHTETGHMDTVIARRG
jgi:hypothetical protein